MTREASLVETECEYAVVNVADDSTTVYTGACLFFGATVSTGLSAHPLPIQDGANVIAGFAASAAAGTTISTGAGIRCNTSLVVDPNNSATGTITVWFRKLRTDI